MFASKKGKKSRNLLDKKVFTLSKLIIGILIINNSTFGIFIASININTL